MNFRAYYCCLQACKTRNALSEKNQAFFTNFFSIALDGFDVTNLITYCTKYLKKKQKKVTTKYWKYRKKTMDVTVKFECIYFIPKWGKIIAIVSRKYPRRSPKRGKKWCDQFRWNDSPGIFSQPLKLWVRHFAEDIHRFRCWCKERPKRRQRKNF